MKTPVKDPRCSQAAVAWTWAIVPFGNHELDITQVSTNLYLSAVWVLLLRRVVAVWSALHVPAVDAQV